MTTLTYARNKLHDAISALTGPRLHDGHPLPSRYHELRDAITHPHISATHRTPPGQRCPCQIDALKLAITIDRRTRQLTGHPHHPANTVQRLHWLTQAKWRPDIDIERIEAITAELGSYAKQIDDLFTPKPVDLPDPCPQCAHQWAYKLSDDGDTIRARALAVTFTTGAVCRHCHATWPPERLVWLGGVLGYRTQGLTTT